MFPAPPPPGYYSRAVTIPGGGTWHIVYAHGTALCTCYLSLRIGITLVHVGGILLRTGWHFTAPVIVCYLRGLMVRHV